MWWKSTRIARISAGRMISNPLLVDVAGADGTLRCEIAAERFRAGKTTSLAPGGHAGRRAFKDL
jgi:hypothetical protein